MPDGLRLALTTLTVAPVGGPEALDRRTAGTAMALAPAVGLLLGGVAAAVLAGADAVTGAPPLAAVLAVATLAVLTRGLHLDGLVDTADGLASYASPERARQVMKSSEVGALGVAALVLVVATQAAALAACLAAGRGPAALVLAAVTARVAVTLACTPATPAAAPGGMGGLVAGSVPARVAGAVAVAAAAAAAGVALAAGGPVDAVRVLAAVGLALLTAAALRRHAVRRIGGLTGDVLGAVVEVATAVVLVAMAAG